MKNNNSPTALGTENLRKLLISYSVPAIIAQMAASLYNIIDSIFIGQGVGAMAISGLAITLPLMNLAAAFGAMVGVGGSTLVSIKMGQKDQEGATRVLGNEAMLNIIIGAAVGILGLIFMNPILYLFGASDQTLPYARDFMQVLLIGNIFTHIYLGLNSMMRATGNPQKAMYITLMTVAINFMLAPTFIFVFHLGIRGAALATVLSQFVAFCVEIHHFSNAKRYIHFRRFAFRLKSTLVKGIFLIGMAPFVLNIGACLVVIVINHRMGTYGGDYAIGAYGIANKILMLFAMLVLGFNQGMQPIAGYNFGAKLYRRVTGVLKYTIMLATTVMIIAFVVCELFPEEICRAFTTDAKLIKMGALGLRITIATFPIVGFQMVTSNFFQSIGKAFLAVILSSTRQMLFLIPFLIFLPYVWGLNGVWMSLPFADTLAALISGITLYIQLKKFNKKAREYEQRKNMEDEMVSELNK